MVIKKVMPRLQALIVIALLASGAAKVNNAYADSPSLSGHDVLDQAVALYEKMQDAEVEVPSELSDTGLDDVVLKSVVLGYVNMDETDTISSSKEVRKQDVMTILYKAVLNYDSSYAISEEETDSILNTCYDNALLDEENRTAYAFFIKQGIITHTSDTEPNKPLNWDSCKILLDLICDSFIQDTEILVNDTSVKIGANVKTVTDAWGAPNRIDESDYGFEWYVYNTDYTKFCMVGVAGGRICAVYTNGDSFELDGIKSGDDASVLEKYKDNPAYRLYADSEGKVDSIMYNPRSVSGGSDAQTDTARALELTDMINAYRARHGYGVYVADDDSSNAAWMEAIGYMGGVESSEAVTISGYDVFSVYRQLIESDNEVLSAAANKDTAIGVSAPVSETDKRVYAAFILNEDDRAKREVTYVAGFEDSPAYDSETQELGIISPVKSVFADDDVEAEAAATEEPEPASEPVIENADEIVNSAGGEDVVLKLGENAAIKYHIGVFDVENQEYIMDSYISPEDSKIIIPADILTQGTDYKISLSAIDASGASVGGESETLISYGEVPEDALDIIGPVSNVEPPSFGLVVGAEPTPEPTATTEPTLPPDATPSPEPTATAEPTATPEPTAEPTPVPEDAPEFLKEGFTIDENDCVYIDTDYIPLQWNSSVYHEFSIDLYNSDGELVTNTIVEDDNSAIIQGVDPGTYYVYITALSRDTYIEKAQDMIRVTVLMPEPVVNEIILDKDDKYYFVYEDEALGVLYFYDEEIIEVEENGETVKKKKIIQKQVKSTKAYRELAKYRSDIEYVTGDPTKTVLSGSGSASGNAIVEEAKKYLGVPYVWGGTTPAGFDCSGLVQYVCAQLGIKVDRVTYDQVTNGVSVTRDQLQPGDLVFFKDSGGNVHHVGIYIGNDEFIHAPHTGDVVKISSLNESYYAGQFCEGRRVY